MAASYCHSPVQLLKRSDVNIKVKVMPVLHVLANSSLPDRGYLCNLLIGPQAQRGKDAHTYYGLISICIEKTYLNRMWLL